MDFKQKLLQHFSLTENDYIHLSQPASFSNLPDYTNFDGVEIIIKRIKQAIEEKQKIIIYGDYDCDGVMATSIMQATFIKLGYKVDYFLPSRYEDGYGLSVKNVEKFKEQGYNLIITVDNGVSQVEAISLANKFGIDVIVTDHHEVVASLAPAYATMHPIISGYGETVSCGAYVAFMLSVGLLGEFNPYLAALAGIATISDMMPLISYNREIVRLALDIINEKQFYGLIKLAETTIVDEATIGMKIAPKINAIGRMSEGHELNILVEYLTTGNKARINDIYEWIISVNDQRKQVMNKAVVEDLDISQDDYAVVVKTSEKEGLIGLLAARYVNKYNKPSIVFTSDSNDANILKASARSKKGFSIVKAFNELAPLLIKYGGHELAGGCSISVNKYEEFKTEFNKLAKIYTLKEDTTKPIVLTLEEVNFDNFTLYQTFGPYGQGWEKPLFKINNIDINIFKYNRDETHIITPIWDRAKLLGFNYPRFNFSSTNYVNLYGFFVANEFRGKLSMNFMIQNIEKI